MSVQNAQRSYSGRGGFTLIEALIASVIVGLGVTAVLMASKSGTQVNAEARDVTRAIYLGQEIREWMVKKSYQDIADLSDVTYKPPKDASGQEISGMTDWSQKITLSLRDSDEITEDDDDEESDMIYVEVEILYGSQSVLTTGWLVTKRE